MARLSVSVALLFFFFAFSPSVARIQISKPKYDAIVRQLTNPLPRSDVKASLRLPSQSNKVKINPLERRPELDGKVVRSDQKNRPIQKQLQYSNVQKAQARPIEKLPEPNGQKAQPVNLRAEPVEKKTKKPVVRLPYLALPVPELIAVKNQSELPIEKNNEESEIVELKSDLDLIIKAQLESIEEEQSKPIEKEEAQPEPNKHVEPETKAAATVEALPLKEVNVRLRSRLPYRLCRHSHLHHIEENLPLPSRSSQVEIPYANDMIYTFGENGDFDPEVFSGTFNHVPPKMFPFLHRHRQHDVNVEEVSKHLPKTAPEEKVSYFLVENDSEKVENDHRRRVLPKTIPFLHRNGPRNLRRQDAIQKVSNHRLPENNRGKDSNHRLPENNHGKDSNHRLPENNHGKDSNHRLTENNRGSVSHIPRKWISFVHQHDLNKEKKPEKKESNLRKRIRKFLGQYFD